MDMFKFKQLSKLSSAMTNKHLGQMVSALGDVVKNIDVNELTQGDFYYLLAYQRICAYSKPIYCHWKCRGDMYKDIDTNAMYTPHQIESLVKEYESADADVKATLPNPDAIKIETLVCDHSNSLPIVLDDLQIVFLEDIVLDERLDVPRANTLADANVLKNDPELGQIVPAAMWIKEGNTLADKIEVLKSQNDLKLFELALLASTTIHHGVRNRVDKKCTVCNTLSTHIFEITPSIFFLV